MTLLRTFALLSLSCAAIVSSGSALAQSDEKPGDKSAQTWSGTLVDADCKAADANAACEVTAVTGHFGLVTTDGKFSKFDTDGDAKVKASLMTAATKTGSIRASVSGKLSGDHIKVQSVQIQ